MQVQIYFLLFWWFHLIEVIKQIPPWRILLAHSFLLSDFLVNVKTHCQCVSNNHARPDKHTFIEIHITAQHYFKKKKKRRLWGVGIVIVDIIQVLFVFSS